MEQLRLSKPIAIPTTLAYKVQSLHLDWGTQYVRVGLVGNNREVCICEVSGVQGQLFLEALAAKGADSLCKRVLLFLVKEHIVDGDIVEPAK